MESKLASGAGAGASNPELGFTRVDHDYLLVNGSGSQLSFGGKKDFAVAVRFVAQPFTPDANPSASQRAPSSARGRPASPSGPSGRPASPSSGSLRPSSPASLGRTMAACLGPKKSTTSALADRRPSQNRLGLSLPSRRPSLGFGSSKAAAPLKPTPAASAAAGAKAGAGEKAMPKLLVPPQFGREGAGLASRQPNFTTLVSKYRGGVQGEYRIGLDATHRPFFYREADAGAVEVLAPEPVTLGEVHEVLATFDGFTMRLYVDKALVGSREAGPAFNQITPN